MAKPEQADTVDVPIASLAIDPDLQIRVDGLDDHHVEALQEAIDLLPPPTCVRRGKDIIPLDGHHTIAARQNAGRKTVRVRIVDPPADGDLYAMAFAANARHGMALTLSDRRAFAEHLLFRDPETSNLEVSRRTGLSPTTVAAIRDGMERSATIAPTDRTVTRGDSTYSYPAPDRKPGELPPPTMGESLGNLGAKVFSGPERVRQRRISSYLRRLAVALVDQDDLLDEPVEAAEAVRLVVGEDAARELAAELAWGTRGVLRVAEAIDSKAR